MFVFFGVILDILNNFRINFILIRSDFNAIEIEKIDGLQNSFIIDAFCRIRKISYRSGWIELFGINSIRKSIIRDSILFQQMMVLSVVAPFLISGVNS